MSLVQITGGILEEGKIYEIGRFKIKKDHRSLNIDGPHGNWIVRHDENYEIVRVLLEGESQTVDMWSGKSLFFFLGELDEQLAIGTSMLYDFMCCECPSPDRFVRWSLANKDIFVAYTSDDLKRRFEIKGSHVVERHFFGSRAWFEYHDLFFLGAFCRREGLVNYSEFFAKLRDAWFFTPTDVKPKLPAPSEPVSKPPSEPVPKTPSESVQKPPSEPELPAPSEPVPKTPETLPKSDPLRPKTRAQIMFEKKVAEDVEWIIKDLDENEGYTIDVEIAQGTESKIREALEFQGFTTSIQPSKTKEYTLTVSCLV